MPIEVFPTPPGLVVGPGLPVSLQTSFIGPFPLDTFWELRIDLDPEPGRAVGIFHVPWDGTTIVRVLPFSNPVESVTTNTFSVAPGTTVHLNATIVTGVVVQDSGSATATWDPTMGLGMSVTENARHTVTAGGLTDAQAQQLAQVDTKTNVLGQPEQLVLETPSGPLQTTLAAIFSRRTLDLLTLAELTDGPTCEPVRVAIANWQYGVIVRVTTIRPDLTPRTPDGQWYFPDLAVLRVFRGADLEYRRGIHTPTFMTETPWQWGSNFLNESLIFGIPPEITIAVDWREGCCGQVFLQRFP